METNKKKFFHLLVFSIVLLFNPNFGVIDILPDFIAWFILARLFERAADSATYFEEARVAFVRLGWVNIAKIPSLFIINMIRSGNTMDNDVFALFSVVFAALEIIFLIPAVQNIFSALFHLGERTEARALITAFPTSRKSKRDISPEALKGYTLFFVIIKCLLYTIPDFFLLTRVSDSGHVYTISKFYPYVLLSCVTAGLILGIIWLKRTVSYVFKAREEGMFFDALSSLAREGSEKKFESKVKIRKTSFALSLLAISSFFSIELIFDNFDEINILPRFIYGVFLLIAVFNLQKHTKQSVYSYVIAALYTASALTSFIFSTRFLLKYEYIDLFKNEAAKRSYLLVEIFGVVELAFLVIYMISQGLVLKAFILNNTGVSPDSDRYRKTEIDYHTSLIKRSYLISGFGIIAGAAKCINIFLNRDVQLIYSDITDITQPTFTASAVPWFNLVVTATALIYIGYSLYFASALKEEVSIKYTFE